MVVGCKWGCCCVGDWEVACGGVGEMAVAIAMVLFDIILLRWCWLFGGCCGVGSFLSVGCGCI